MYQDGCSNFARSSASTEAVGASHRRLAMPARRVTLKRSADERRHKTTRQQLHAVGARHTQKHATQTRLATWLKAQHALGRNETNNTSEHAVVRKKRRNTSRQTKAAQPFNTTHKQTPKQEHYIQHTSKHHTHHKEHNNPTNNNHQNKKKPTKTKKPKNNKKPKKNKQSLEGFCSTIELHPRLSGRVPCHSCLARVNRGLGSLSAAESVKPSVVVEDVQRLVGDDRRQTDAGPMFVWLWKAPLAGSTLINVPSELATIRRPPARTGP